MRRLINLWPPLLCSGIRVRRITPDWREVEVELRLAWWNRNAVGTLFGGSLFAMTDPFYALMLLHNLGPGFIVWDRAAEIDFVAPGRDVARAQFRLPLESLEEIRAATANGDKYLPTFSVDITDRAGRLVSRVNRQLYVRRARPPGD